MVLRGSSSTTTTCLGSLKFASWPRSASTTSPTGPAPRRPRPPPRRSRGANADHRAFDHAGQRVDRLLHLLRIDVEPAADDEVLRPPDDGDVPVRGDAGDVAGDEEPVLGRNSSAVFSGIRQYPWNTFGPRTSSTPTSPGGSSSPSGPRTRNLDARQRRADGPGAPCSPSSGFEVFIPVSVIPYRSRIRCPVRAFELRVGRGEQRRRPRDEQPHPRRRLQRQVRAGEQPGVEGRHAHQHARPRKQPDRLVPGSNFGRKIIRPPFISIRFSATNRPWVWKSGRAWISTSSGSKAHAACSVETFDQEVAAAGQHAL